MSRPGIALALFLAAQAFLFLGVQASRLFTFLGKQASRLGLHPINFACMCSDMCLVPADSTSEGPPANLDSAKARGPDSDPVAPVVVASVAPTPSMPVVAMAAESPHGPLAPHEAANLVEEAVDDASLDPETSETAAY
ncbi:hypothetical protein V6N13_110339 [Hibiscus sabdariffa]